ncbi:MAG: hypothetical protein PHH82_01265 [Candidatus ainarchaeum sp.]|nr:hypothetical protein [Candidatus ainarchaeum sp.]
MNKKFHEEMFEQEFNSNSYLQKYLKKKGLEFVKLLGEGRSAWIIVVSHTAHKKNTKPQLPTRLLTIKLEKKRSTRSEMVEKETKYMNLANKSKIGPKFVDSNINGRFIVYEYFDAISLINYLDEFDKKEFVVFLKALFAQGKKLDKIGLDHGQLVGKGTNIMVLKSGKPIIVDFEKSSNNRKTHNVNVLISYFFSEKSQVADKVEKILGKDFEKIKKEFL